MAPAAWLVEHASAIPRRGPVLDVASGRGRHALYLARAGFTVHAVDRDGDALAALAADAAAEGLPLTVERLDLESGDPRLGRSRFAGIVVVHYLHRPLMPALVAALQPGGVLIYETFTVHQAARGRPTNPDFLLRDRELPALVAPLVVLAHREGEVDGRMVASIVAARPEGDGDATLAGQQRGW